MMTSPPAEKRKELNFLKIKLLSAGTIVLVLALGFSTMLISSSLEKLYVRSLVSSYQVIGSEFRRKLQKAVRYGKKINKFVGMDLLMEEPLGHMVRQTKGEHSTNDNREKKQEDSDIFVAVAMPDGEIKYSTDNGLIGSMLPGVLYKDFISIDSQDADPENERFIKFKNTYFVPLVVQDNKGVGVATAILAFHERHVKALVNAAWLHNLRVAWVVLLCGSFLTIIMLNVILPRERARIRKALPWLFDRVEWKKTNEIPKRGISVGLFLIIIACQIGFSVVSIRAFNTFYLKINGDMTVTLNTLMRENVEYLLEKRLPLNKFFGIEKVMGEMLSQFPEVENITLFNNEGKPLYHANQQNAYNLIKTPMTLPKEIVDSYSSSESKYNFTSPVRKEGNVVGSISSNIYRDVIKQKLKGLLLDAGTVLVISALFALELLLMIYLYLEKKASVPRQSANNNYGIIRPAAFLFLFGTYISISFVPLHMESLFEPLFGLPKDLVLGLPISVEMFFAGISILLSGAWIDKRGWHEPFLMGLLTTGIGVLDSWLAQSAVHFILSRGIVGAGYGLALMAAQGFVLTQTDENTKARGIANFFAGVYTGSICGGAAGAMLAERIGYNPVFLVGSVIVFLVIPYSFLSMREAIKKPAIVSDKPVSPAPSMKHFINFLFNKNIISLIFLIVIPAATIMVGFINYFSPIYLHRMGVSQSNIGRVFMLYGICLIFIGPFISKRIDSVENKKAFIVIGEVIGAAGLLTFLFFGGLWAIAITTLMLGISGSFISSRISYVLKLRASRELGGGKSIAVVNATYRLGQVLGPILFSWILVAFGTYKKMSLVGVIYLIAIFLFFLSTERERKNKASK
ncbi:MAG TPA: MFS transporter [Deltaproteobacteria bacterium]|nr:MFS transporter [Deltaproteobacteria bacterium]